MSTLTILSHTRRFPLPRILSLTSLRRYNHKNSASAKLFEDAKREEQEEKQTIERRQQTTNALLTRQADRNWDGEEPIADAVLRMLVDKYKPLRSGTILSADEKLSKAAPNVRVGGIPLAPSESAREETLIVPNRPLTYPKVDPSKPLKDQPLLPAVEGHRPWHTSFTAPSHATASIRLGNIEPLKSRPSPVLDEKAIKLEKEKRKRFQTALKLEGAKESIQNHRLGVGQRRRTNPLTMKGWTSLVEERIEVCRTLCLDSSQLITRFTLFGKRARAQGHLDRIEGRGKPMVISDGERNPFIAREEFLMNRIVQRNGAAPPWVELQAGKLDFVPSVRFPGFLTRPRQKWSLPSLRSGGSSGKLGLDEFSLS